MTRLDTETLGQGPDLLLLHSLLTDRSSYRALAEKLAGERRLTIVNMPGFGTSPPAEPLAGYASRIVEAMDELGLPQTCDVLGNGLGGFVALRMAADFPGRFNRLALLGSAIAFPEQGRATFRLLAEKAGTVGMSAIADAAMQRMFPADYMETNPEIVADRRAVFCAIDPKVFADACLALAELDLSEDVGSIENPTLIVTGALDGATPPALGAALAGRLPHGRFVELDDAGHAPHIQATDRLVRVLAPFLDLDQNL